MIKPDYYRGEVECIDAIKSATRRIGGVEGFCVGNVIKYVWRYREKNGVEDLEKAEWYLRWLIKWTKEQEERKREL